MSIPSNGMQWWWISLQWGPTTTGNKRSTSQKRPFLNAVHLQEAITHRFYKLWSTSQLLVIFASTRPSITFLSTWTQGVFRHDSTCWLLWLHRQHDVLTVIRLYCLAPLVTTTPSVADQVAPGIQASHMKRHKRKTLIPRRLEPRNHVHWNTKWKAISNTHRIWWCSLLGV